MTEEVIKTTGKLYIKDKDGRSSLAKFFDGTPKAFEAAVKVSKPSSVKEFNSGFPTIAGTEKDLVELAWGNLVIKAQNACRVAGVLALDNGKTVADAIKAGQEALIEYLKSGKSPSTSRGPSADEMVRLLIPIAKDTANAKSKDARAALKAYGTSQKADEFGVVQATEEAFQALRASYGAITAQPSA
jgi:hypothetical protein